MSHELLFIHNNTVTIGNYMSANRVPHSVNPSRAQLRQGILASALDDPSMERYRTSRARQQISILQMLLSIVLITVPEVLFLWHTEDPAMPRWAFVAAAVVLYLPWMFVTGMLNGSVSGIFDLREAQLDEIERRDRDAAYRTAYRLMFPVVIVVSGGVFGLVRSGQGPAAFWAIALLFFLFLLMPQHIAAWRLAARGDADAANADVGSHGP